MRKRQLPPRLRADRERLVAGIKELRNSIEIETEPDKADHR